MKFSKMLLLVFVMSFSFAGLANNTDTLQNETEKTESNTIKNRPLTMANDTQVAVTQLSEGSSVLVTYPDTIITTSSPNPSAFNLPDKITDLTTSLSWWDFLYVLIFTILGYLSPFIPGLRKIGDTEIRVVVGGVVLIMIFVAMDFNNALMLAVEFFAATQLYKYILSAIKKTPKPTVEATILKKE